jgi:hypothetical protein
VFHTACCAGVEVALLKAFLKICSHGSAVQPVINSALASIVPLILDTDGMTLKGGGQLDPVSGRVVGLTQDIDIKFMQDNPSPSPTLVKSMIHSEANQMLLGSLDGRVVLPIGTDFTTKNKSKETVLQLVVQRAKQLQCCLGCLTSESVPTSHGVVSGSGAECNRQCNGELSFTR